MVGGTQKVIGGISFGRGSELMASLGGLNAFFCR